MSHDIIRAHVGMPRISMSQMSKRCPLPTQNLGLLWPVLPPSSKFARVDLAIAILILKHGKQKW